MEINIREFCETAEVNGVNSSIWLVDWDKQVATHCCDVTYNRGEWDDVSPPSREKFQEFLKDENWNR